MVGDDGQMVLVVQLMKCPFNCIPVVNYKNSWQENGLNLKTYVLLKMFFSCNRHISLAEGSFLGRFREAYRG